MWGLQSLYKGIGDLFRELSQERLMRRLNKLYRFKNVLQAPYERFTDPEVDNKVFTTFTTDTSLENYSDNSFDLVWNFGLLQRSPEILYDMLRVSRRYVLLFVPNGINPGHLIHRIYHIVRDEPCKHLERGNPELMTMNGVTNLLHSARVKVIEKGYIDAPLWPDTVVPLAELFGSTHQSTTGSLRLPFSKKMLYVEKLTLHFGKVLAHHIYVFGKIYSRKKNPPTIFQQNK
jgi:hypothetical protein